MNGICYLTHYFFAYSNIPSSIKAVAVTWNDGHRNGKSNFYSGSTRGTQHRKVWNNRPFLFNHAQGVPGFDSRRGKSKTR